jgi:hypothetical protein
MFYTASLITSFFLLFYRWCNVYTIILDIQCRLQPRRNRFPGPGARETRGGRDIQGARPAEERDSAKETPGRDRRVPQRAGDCEREYDPHETGEETITEGGGVCGEYYRNE